MPFLHFSGNFKFQVPYFNNDPQHDALDTEHDTLDGKHVRYDSVTQNYSKDQVRDLLWCDPLKYFEFEFSDVFVRRITYDDGSSVESSKEDPVIDKRVILKG